MNFIEIKNKVLNNEPVTEAELDWLIREIESLLEYKEEIKHMAWERDTYR